MNPFAATAHDTPRMTPEELDELLVHIIRVPAVYSEARRFHEGDAWNPHGERQYRILVDCLFALGDSKLYPPGEIPYVAVHNEVRPILADDPMLGDSPGLIGDIVGRPTDADPYDGLLYHAYKVVDATDLDTPYAIKLLKKFLRERQVLDKVRRVIDEAGGRIPAGLQAALVKAQETAAAIEAIGHPGAASLADDLPRLVGWLESSRGQKLLGLETGVLDLDDHTAGLRGVLVMGAMPGVGKTSLAVQLACGVARHHEFNDAAVVFVSLDMDAIEVEARILSHVAGMDWATLRRGSPELRGNPHGPHLNEAHAAKLEEARTELAGEIGKRIRVIGRKDLHGTIDAARLTALLAEAKAAVAAKRGLLIVDFLQLIAPPPAVRNQKQQSDLDADKFRIQVMQDVVARTRTPANPQGDAVVAISEVRKPPDAKQDWGGNMADLMGAARTAYMADAVLLYRRLMPTDLTKIYGIGKGKEQVEQLRAQLDTAGISPMMLLLAKGRDGMTRGEWPMEFVYRRSTWRRPSDGPFAPATGGWIKGAPEPPGDDDDQDDQDEPQTARERLLEALAAVPGGDTATGLAQAAKLPGGTAGKILEELVGEDLVVQVAVTKPHGKGGKGSSTHTGYRLVGSTNGQPKGPNPAINPV